MARPRTSQLILSPEPEFGTPAKDGSLPGDSRLRFRPRTLALPPTTPIDAYIGGLAGAALAAAAGTWYASRRWHNA